MVLGIGRLKEHVILYAMRHGADEDMNIIGGWNDPDLKKTGRKDAEEAAKILSGKGIKRIYCSDLKRSEETADILAKELDIKDPVQDFKLRTWNKGYLNGAKRTDRNHNVLEHYKTHPDQTIPEGESRTKFEDRTEARYDKYIDEAKESPVTLLVLHNSNLKELQRYCNGKTDSNPDSVLPGGIVEVTERNGNLHCRVIYKDRKK